MRFVETIIVGGGQAGLATSFLLKQRQRDHLVLEKSDIVAPAWSRERWDSFTLVTPNWTINMPGLDYSGEAADGFMKRDEVVSLLNRYVVENRLPLELKSRVESVKRDEANDAYWVRTEKASYMARNVVIATGLFQRPKILPMRLHVPMTICQLHSSEYERPGLLPPGAVLVVGSSQSGAQIAQELRANGREVYLSVGRSGRAPRSYRGIDSSRWQELLGWTQRKVTDLKSPNEKFAPNPHISGKLVGGSLNLHQFSQDGIKLLGSVLGIQNGIMKLAPDLAEGLAFADQFEKSFTGLIDQYITQHGLLLPTETLPALQAGYAVPVVEQLDLKQQGIGSIIWANGFEFDFDFVKLPIFDADGYPIQKRGVTASDGLYFIGLPWLYSQKSGLLSGIGEDAEYLVAQIVRRCELEAADLAL